MMLTPWGPSAVPTGGAGVALPAANCSLIVVCIFFGAIFLYPKSLSSWPELHPGTTRGATVAAPRKLSLAQLLDAGKIQFHRRCAPENRYRNFQTAVVVIDLFHRAVEIRKGPVHDAYLLIALVD